MATITISNAGGNWNSTATWVGGVIPVAADTINATATSGSLIINVAAQVEVVDLTLYTSTLELRQTLTAGRDNSVVGSALLLSSGMTITSPIGSVGRLQVQAGRVSGRTMITRGCVIPFFIVGQNQNQTFLTLLDNITCDTYLQTTNNQNCLLNDFQINITNYLTEGGGIGRIQGTTKLYLNGSNCSFNNSLPNTFISIGNPLYIDTPGTLTITGYIQVVPFSFSASTGIYYLNGTIAGNKIIKIGNPAPARGVTGGVNTTYQLDLNGAGTWDTITISNNQPTLQSTIQLLSNLNFNNLYITPESYWDGAQITTLGNTRQPVRFIGSGALKGGAIYTNKIQNNNIPISGNTNGGGEIQLNTGVAHTASYLSFIGGDDTSFNRVLIRSISGGTQANLSFTGNSQSVLFTNFTDINASGGNTIYAYKGTISNSQNILPITTYVPTSSNTFLNG